MYNIHIFSMQGDGVFWLLYHVYVMITKKHNINIVYLVWYACRCNNFLQLVFIWLHVVCEEEAWVIWTLGERPGNRGGWTCIMKVCIKSMQYQEQAVYLGQMLLTVIKMKDVSYHHIIPKNKIFVSFTGWEQDKVT